jgi:ribonucleoside-diphosphate reductase beta chain
MEVFNDVRSPDTYMQSTPPLFFGEAPGLFNTVHKPYPKIWQIYKTMKSLDWDEAEFDFTQCNMDFNSCSKSVYDMMIRTLAWQWEADSVASRSIAPLLAPFITDSSLWAAYQRVSDNEVIHSATYSEIVRTSFNDPEKVFADILSVRESIIRMDSVNKVFSKLYKTSHRYALDRNYTDDVYDDVFMAIVALLLLERLQFMASFSITFAICSTGPFQSIGKAVQKIAQDELEVHSELDKEVLRVELATERGKAAYKRLKPRIEELANEVVASELKWVEYLFSEGRELVGVNANTVSAWVLYNAKEVFQFLDVKSEHKFPKTNPMPFMENWINIGNTQPAPQEQNANAYKVNVLVRDDSQTTFETDF